ncbi:MAG: hypothetical protein HKN70_09430 [Gammaproteobacteria bacterium]|nr:hypothetical protein [Gammaproteobacteria bacterium]
MFDRQPVTTKSTPRQFAGSTCRKVLLLTVLVTLAACGGSGGGDATPTPVTDPGAAGDTLITGKATYDLVPQVNFDNSLNYNSIRVQPIRGATVELLNSAGSLLERATTSASGDYQFTVADGANVRLRVRAELLAAGSPAWDVKVINNTNNGSLYAIEGGEFTAAGAAVTHDIHAPSGWTGSGYGQTRAAAPFAVLDVIYTGMQKVLMASPGVVFPPLSINWSPDNRPTQGDEARGEIGTSFYRNVGDDSHIFLLGKENVDTDEYDRHIVAHEWTHYLENRLGRSDSLGGGHSSGDRLDPRVAFGEGLGYAFAGAILDNPNTIDTLGPGQEQGSNINVEDNSILNPGWYNEGSVQAAIYDFYDSAVDGPDTVELGFVPLFDVLTGQFADGVALTTIHAYATALKLANPAAAVAIDAIIENQHIASENTDAFARNETNDADNANDVLPIYTALPLDGRTVNLCSIGGNLPPASFGTYNKLSNRRFLHFETMAPGTVSITATGPNGSDPDLILHRAGILQVAESVSATETLSTVLEAGRYVIEIYEYSNVTDNPRGRTCFGISATVNQE